MPSFDAMDDELQQLDPKDVAEWFTQEAEEIQKRHNMKPDFEASSSQLAVDDFPVIDELADLILKAQTRGHRLEVLVDGHADTGQRPERKPPLLQELCQSRAISVARRLEEKGVDRRMINVQGSGATGINPLTGEPVRENYNKRVYFSCTATPLGGPQPRPGRQRHAQQDRQQAEERVREAEQRAVAAEKEADAAKQKANAAERRAKECEQAAEQAAEKLSQQAKKTLANGPICCVVVPPCGVSMAWLHGFAELVWILATIAAGKALFATLVTGASLESADTCPDLEDCGSTASLMFMYSIVASLWTLAGILLMVWSHRVDTHQPRDEWSPDKCYVFGCLLGLIIFVVQVYVLVLPFSSTLVVPAAGLDHSSKQRLLLDDVSAVPISAQGSSNASNPQRRLEEHSRTGFCANNGDWQNEPDIVCPRPTWLKRAAPGRTVEECCDCSMEERAQAFCVDTEAATDYERNDQCSVVMRYAKCGLPLLPSEQIDEQSITTCAQEERNQGYPGGPQHWTTTDTELQQKCLRCYEASFRQGSFAQLASESPDTMQTLCTQSSALTDNAYECTYEYRLLADSERCYDSFCTSVTDSTGVTSGNSIYLEGPMQWQPVVADVECSSPATLRFHTTEGRTPEECCEVVDMCVGNTDTDAQPDIICNEVGSARRPDATYIHGRGPQACCYTAGLCSGNDNSTDQPDIVCPSPSTLRSPGTVGRDEDACCYVTGKCSGNSNPAEDVDCQALGLAGRTLKPNSDYVARGDDSRVCCECRGTDSSLRLTRPDAWCVQSFENSPSDHLEDAVLAGEDQCSQVMRYAKCPELSSFCGTCIDNCEACEECAEEYPYPTWQEVADNSRGQLRCMEEDLGETAANRFECTYIFRRFELHEEQAACVDIMCAGNTDPDIDPDVTCSNGLQLLPNPDQVVGRTEQECCVITGRCTGNTDSEAEPDIECPFPSKVTDEVGAVGRDEASCCIISGMCVGNTPSVDEPDVQCSSPLRTKQGAELIVGRSTTLCCERVGFCAGNDVPEVEDVVCPAPTSLVVDAENVVGRTNETCCYRTGLCVGNADTVVEPDIACSAPAFLRNGAANRIGRSADPNGPCCEVTGMCAGNSNADKEPDVFCGDGAWNLVDDATHVPRGSPDEQIFRCCRSPCGVKVCTCGDLGPKMMDTTIGQVALVALLAVVVAILRVCAMVQYLRHVCPHEHDPSYYEIDEIDREDRAYSAASV